MYKNCRHSMTGWASLLVVVLLMLCACSDNDGWSGNEELPTVSAHFTFSLPARIVGTRQKAVTRMTPDVVQEGKKEDFRGIKDIHLFCYDQYPTENSTKLGKTIELNTDKSTELEEASETDYSLTQPIRIPVGTTYFAFYGRADDSPRTHADRMKYGVIETVGLGKDNYTDNKSIRFRPVPICTSSDLLGGSEVGHNLLNLLNELVNITGPEPAPNDKWATGGSVYLNEAYQVLTSLRTLSSFNVQYTLGYIWLMAHQSSPDGQGDQLAAAIADKIQSCSVWPLNPEKDTLTLKDNYQGFPDDIHLPAGAARIEWDAEKGQFVVPVSQDYGKGLEVASINDYCYPMNLQYQIFSDILTSDSIVLVPPTESTDESTGDPSTSGGQGSDPSSGDPTTDPNNPDDGSGSSGQQYENWSDLLSDAYGDNAGKTVEPTTQSVAMVDQVEYAVGRLALRTRITTDNCYDAKGKYVDVSKGFTLKGYIVGGQREVDFDFQPVEGSHRYAIYDVNIADTCKEVKRRYWTGYNYILGLGTASNENIYLALELENNGDAFQGADGIIAHGATFYLVATMDPSKGTGYTVGSLDQIFNKDFATRVNLTILGGWKDRDGDGVPDPDLDEHGNPKPPTGLATATYGMPNMEIPHPVVGVSVDLSWGEGLYFDDVEL